MNRALVARVEGWMFLVYDTGSALVIRMQRDGGSFMEAVLTAEQVGALQAFLDQGAPGR